MGLRASAKFKFGNRYTKIIPLNASLKTPLPIGDAALTTITADGGVGPFDFSGATNSAAVPLKAKIGNAAELSVTIDVSTGSGSVDESAVTAAELATAIGVLLTGITASAATGRIVLTVTTPGTSKYLQVYGEAALIADFGQGYGLKFIQIDTQQSFSVDPVMKDSETITITDSNGLDTEYITDGYRKGFTSTLTLTDFDLSLRAVLEGGTLSADLSFYEAPNSASSKAYFAIETLQEVFTKGSNKQQDLVGYVVNKFFTASAVKGTEAGDRNWQPDIYTITGTEYKDPDTGVQSADSTVKYYTKAAFEALDWFNI